MKRSGFLKEHSQVLMWSLRGIDCAVLLLGSWLAMLVALDRSAFNTEYLIAIIISVLASFTIFPFFGLYRAWRGATLIDEVRAVFLAWSSLFLFLALLAVLTKSNVIYSRLWFGCWYAGGLFALVSSRILLRSFLSSIRQRGMNTRSVVIVGTSSLGLRVAKTLQNEYWAGLNVKGFFSQSGGASVIEGLPVLGQIEDCPDYLRKNSVDQVWICLPLAEEQKMRELFQSLDDIAVSLRFVPDIFGFQLLNHSFTEIAGMPVIDLSSTPMSGVNQIVKEVEDRVLALIILIVVSPLLLGIALAIRVTSPGPVIFKQRRFGINGEEIKVYKFRSMTVVDNGSEVMQATKNDSRVTPLGSFLRKTSLDELPQFLNVLQGRMSIVGPRPHAVAHNEAYKALIGGYMKRHLVKPGITGWAQVNGWRGETDTLEKMQKRVEFDLYYIENWSLWFDLKIILLTFFKGFVHKNAY